MATFSFDETPDSRGIAYQPPTYTLQYKAVGEVDEQIVFNRAMGLAPTSVATPLGLLYRQDVQLQPAGFSQYIVNVPYGVGENAPSTYTLKFDTTGATIKIKASKEHIADYPNNNNKFGGAIGVTSDLKVEGADIVVPALKYTLTYRHPAGSVTISYSKLLASITGQTNADAGFLTFATGELLYLGSTGECSMSAQSEVDYHFAASVNNPSLTIGNITGIVKAGWHYAWVEFKDAVANGFPAVRPRAVYVERVYDAVSFAASFGFS